MVPDFNDIVFERLNKEYGAYCLRKSYNHILSLSILAAVIIGCAVVLIPYFRDPVSKEVPYNAKYVTVENLMPPDEYGGSPLAIVLPAARPSKAAARRIAPELEYIAPIVVDSVLPAVKQELSVTDTLPNDKNSSGNSESSEKGTGSVSGGSINGTGRGGDGGYGNGNGAYSKVDEMPTFRGGDINKFREWVQKKTKYPREASANGVQGKVSITFIIEQDGSVSNVKVAHGVDSLIDNEASKAVESSPKWAPGKHKGKVVRVSYYIIVNFEL